MKLLVIGSGGREHAMVRKLRESPRVDQIYVAPGNAGIAVDATCVDIQATDLDGMVDFAQKNAIDYVVVAPDDPLALGMVDAMNAVGIPAFGPEKKAAVLESSKAFAKAFMVRYGIPTPSYQMFDRYDRAVGYIKSLKTYPVVIKADGLARGKGVVIVQDQETALVTVASMMKEGAFGSSGNRIVVEEFVEGMEVSVLAFTDGTTVVPMVSSMDHKRAFNGDHGPNTGGMGTIAPHPWYTPAIAERCMVDIFLPTIHAMNDMNRQFRGCLYFGLMLTSKGPQVIEYNCRFGDPEAQVVLSLLESDLLDVMMATSEGRLADCPVRWKEDGYAACVVLASEGYPDNYKTGFPITGLNARGQINQPQISIYHAGTRHENGKFVTAGGRVLGVTAVGSTMTSAIMAAYEVADRISFEGAYCRRDIGLKAIIGIVK